MRGFHRDMPPVDAPLLFGFAVLLAWLYLSCFHAGFWRIVCCSAFSAPDEWPRLVAVIPARNEAPVIGETIRSLFAQDYPGALRVVVVDDHSDDGTSAEALRAASEADREADLTLLAAEPLPAGWTGKVWAMEQGLIRGLSAADPAPYVLFSDADISHGPRALRELVCRAETDGCDLVSFMVRLQCATPAERLMIPAFVFFFRMLYPFRRVNDVSDQTAAAAGGTMLVRRTALARIGGLSCIRGELIDDCALARVVKSGGHRIWLGLSETSRSTRGYGRLSEILDMIARTAYTQLRYCPGRLAACAAGLAVVFFGPPLLLIAGGWPAALGSAAWLMMALLYFPMLRFYGQSGLWAPLLPVTAAVYLWATLLSAWRYHRGRDGQWKGRLAPPRASK